MCDFHHRQQQREKRKRYDSLLWQTPKYQQKIPQTAKRNHETINEKSDYTTIMDVIRTISWSNNSQLVWLTCLRAQPSHFPATDV